MKVGYISPILFNIPAGRAGPERVAYNLNEAVYEMGVETTFFGCKNSQISGNLKYLFNEELNSNEVFARSDRMYRGTFLYRHVVNAYKYYKDLDIMHSHLLDWTIPVAGLVQDIPTIITLHNNPKSWNLDSIRQFAGPQTHFVAVSNSQAKLLEPDIKTNLHVVRNGIEVNEIPFQERKEEFLLFVGRLSENKGADVAIRVAKETGHKIIVIGKPVLSKDATREYYENTLKEPLSDENVVHIPFVEHHELFDYFKRAKALILPLRDPDKEAFGLVFVEAMATGTPVLTFRNRLTEEIIEDAKTGLLVDTEEEMYRAIGQIDGLNPLDCRRWVEENFSRERMARDYIELYESIID